MENIIKFLSLLLIVIPSIVTSQNLPKDSLLGHVKKIREKVIFLTEKENPQFLYNDDYGHSGFMDPETTESKFFRMWYESNYCYFLNYERHFNKEKRIVKDIWFGKKDNFMRSYKYLYDKKGRLISTIDSSEYSVDTRNHYFQEYGDYIDENIIDGSLKSNIFSHTFKRYKKGKIILTKDYRENGIINEYINRYNEEGKLIFRITKTPYSYKRIDENSTSYGIHDSIGLTYKSMANEYDVKGRLVKKKYFEVKDYTNISTPGREMIFIYNDNNLITEITDDKNWYITYKNYRYDKHNRLIEKYCCDKDISKAGIIQKYTYKNNKIIKLIYSAEEPSDNPKMNNYKVTYSYKYDNNNNWIEILKTVNGAKLYKWVREIEYY